MDSTPSLAPILGYRAGVWAADRARTEIAFTVRQLQVTKVRGRLTGYDLDIVTAEDPLRSRVDAMIDLSSVDTGNRRRDNHLRSAAILDVQTYPTMTYHSTGLRPAHEGWIVEGELTLHGNTRKVPLSVGSTRFLRAHRERQRAKFVATAEFNRSDFGISIPLEGRGLVIGGKVCVALRVEAVLQESDPCPPTGESVIWRSR